MLFLVFGTILLFHSCGASYETLAADNKDGSIVEREPYVFPSYERANIKNITTKEEYERAINDRRFEFERVKYWSDGLKVIAYLCKPASTGSNKLPAIIFNRGSVVRDDIAPELVSFFQRLAGEGFVIVAPMYRQSAGGEGRDEMGGGDVNDLMNVAELVKSLEFIDINNLFLYGESRGGMMAYLAVKRNFPANAAAVYGAFTDLDALLREHPEIYRPQLLSNLWPNFESRKTEIVTSRSAACWPERLSVPLLIMHGGADQSVNPAQSLAMAQKLQSLGKTYELIIYADDNHVLSRNAEDRDRRALAWFKKHLKPKT